MSIEQLQAADHTLREAREEARTEIVTELEGLTDEQLLTVRKNLADAVLEHETTGSSEKLETFSRSFSLTARLRRRPDFKTAVDHADANPVTADTDGVDLLETLQKLGR